MRNADGFDGQEPERIGCDTAEGKTVAEINYRDELIGILFTDNTYCIFRADACDGWRSDGRIDEHDSKWCDI